MKFKILSLIYKFEFSFQVFAIGFVIVTQEHAYSKPHSRIVCIISAWPRLLHMQPAQLNVVT